MLYNSLPQDLVFARLLDGSIPIMAYREDRKGHPQLEPDFEPPVLRFGEVPAGDPDFAVFAAAFKLDPAKRSFPFTADKLDPFLAGAPPAGVDVLDLETRFNDR